MRRAVIVRCGWGPRWWFACWPYWPSRGADPVPISPASQAPPGAVARRDCPHTTQLVAADAGFLAGLNIEPVVPAPPPQALSCRKRAGPRGGEPNRTGGGVGLAPPAAANYPVIPAAPTGITLGGGDRLARAPW